MLVTTFPVDALRFALPSHGRILEVFTDEPAMQAEGMNWTVWRPSWIRELQSESFGIRPQFALN